MDQQHSEVPRKRVTIADIAKLAGVSRPTVSRALNGHPEVGAATRSRIRELADSLGYVASPTAAGLRTGRYRALAMAVPAYTLWWAEPVLRGAAEEAARQRHTLLFHVVADGDDGSAGLAERFLPLAPIDGVLLAMPDTLDGYRDRLDPFGIPVVAIDDRMSESVFPTVRGDNAEGARMAVRHLLGLGRTRIAATVGSEPLSYLTERHRGYREALEEAGLPYRPELVVPGRQRPGDGELAVRRLLDTGVEFDALFASSSDYVAIGAMRALRRAGVRVPEDVAVVGYDDIPAAEYSDPALSTIRQPFYDMGAIAVRRLVHAVQDRPQPLRSQQVPDVEILDNRLVVRESCGGVPPVEGP
jgi:LacI family transcriptional regulator